MYLRLASEAEKTGLVIRGQSSRIGILHLVLHAVWVDRSPRAMASSTKICSEIRYYGSTDA
jgi:hypothetical protein